MSLASVDHYAVLGVAPSVDRQELRRVWRQLVDRWHPDRAGPESAARYERMELAYAVLSDPLARRTYDSERAGESSAARGGSDLASRPPVRLAPSVRLSRLSGPLNGLIARGIARWAESDVIELSLDAQEEAAGGMVEISLRVPIRCPVCSATAITECSRCRNSGAIEELFSAWLAVRPGVPEGARLTPSAWLPGMLQRVYFRVRITGERGRAS
jgi:molecular chaperone DnaJ